MRYPDLSLSPSSVSRLTKEIGLSRDLQLRFFHRYVDGSTHLIFDGTRLICFSKDIGDSWNENVPALPDRKTYTETLQ